MQTRTPVGHSARVRLSLHVAGKVVPLSQVGPDFCRSRELIDLPPQNAEIWAEIDDVRHVDRVFLINGISSESRDIAIRDLDVRPELNAKLN